MTKIKTFTLTCCRLILAIRNASLSTHTLQTRDALRGGSFFVAGSAAHVVLATLSACLWLSTASQAQTLTPTRPATEAIQINAQPPEPLVTAIASSSRVRYVTVGEVNQTRLQVFSPEGTQVFDSEFRLGNLIDWQLQNQEGSQVVDGSYLYLVSVKNFANHLTQKFGTVVLEKGQTYLEQGNLESLPTSQLAALDANKQSSILTSVDRVGAAGLTGTIANPETTAPNSPLPLPGHAVSPIKKVTGTTNTTAASGTGSLNSLAKWVDNSGTLGNTNIFENSGGRIGIGTSTPATNLDLQTNAAGSGGFFVGNSNNNGSAFSEFGLYNDLGAASRTQFYMRSSTYSGNDGANSLNVYTNSSGPINMGTNGVPRLRIESNGNVGIGTTTPTTNLEVKGNIPGPGGFLVGNINNNPSAFSEFGLYNNLGPAFRAQFYMRSSTYAGADGANSFNIYTNSISPINIGTSGVPRLRIDSSGRVGIGTTNPQSKLDVAGAVSVAGDITVSGDAFVSGNIAAKYQDLAEWVPSSKQLAAGTVVVLDRNQPNAVVASYRSYDTRIAGVVSAQPGVILGERGAGRVMVATIGRVMVNVDARSHPIRIGDLLVTSNKSGMAMWSRPFKISGMLFHRPGTVIGKALQPLAAGTGSIMVLLSLH
jgi:hypothetical protein